MPQPRLKCSVSLTWDQGSIVCALGFSSDNRQLLSPLSETGSFPEQEVLKMQQLVFDYRFLISYHVHLFPQADSGEEGGTVTIS